MLTKKRPAPPPPPRRFRAAVAVPVVLAVLLLGGYASTSAAPLMQAKPEYATRTVVAVRHAIESWRSEHGANECPSIQALKESGAIDSSTRPLDPWGTPYRITCTADETVVRSFGPDKKPSDDDIISRPEGESAQADEGARASSREPG